MGFGLARWRGDGRGSDRADRLARSLGVSTPLASCVVCRGVASSGSDAYSSWAPSGPGPAHSDSRRCVAQADLLGSSGSVLTMSSVCSRWCAPAESIPVPPAGTMLHPCSPSAWTTVLLAVRVVSGSAALGFRECEGAPTACGDLGGRSLGGPRRSPEAGFAAYPRPCASSGSIPALDTAHGRGLVLRPGEPAARRNRRGDSSRPISVVRPRGSELECCGRQQRARFPLALYFQRACPLSTVRQPFALSCLSLGS